MSEDAEKIALKKENTDLKAQVEQLTKDLRKCEISKVKQQYPYPPKNDVVGTAAVLGTAAMNVAATVLAKPKEEAPASSTQEQKP